MIHIQGFTPLQMRLADHIWECETANQVEMFIQSLPSHRRPIALAVRDMIVCAAIDEAVETQTEFNLVNEIIDSVK